MEICIFWKKERDEVGMTIKFDAKEIVCFAFVPVGSRIYACNCWYYWGVTINSCPNDYSAKIKIVPAEIINNLQLVVFYPVNTCNAFNKELCCIKNCDCLA